MVHEHGPAGAPRDDQHADEYDRDRRQVLPGARERPSASSISTGRLGVVVFCPGSQDPVSGSMVMLGLMTTVIGTTGSSSRGGLLDQAPTPSPRRATPRTGGPPGAPRSVPAATDEHSAEWTLSSVCSGTTWGRFYQLVATEAEIIFGVPQRGMSSFVEMFLVDQPNINLDTPRTAPMGEERPPGQRSHGRYLL
jgi:hypothetical protein